MPPEPALRSPSPTSPRPTPLRSLPTAPHSTPPPRVPPTSPLPRLRRLPRPHLHRRQRHIQQPDQLPRRATRRQDRRPRRSSTSTRAQIGRILPNGAPDPTFLVGGTNHNSTYYPARPRYRRPHLGRRRRSPPSTTSRPTASPSSRASSRSSPGPLSPMPRCRRRRDPHLHRLRPRHFSRDLPVV